MMDALLKTIIELAPEYGINLKEDASDVEGEVADRLKRAAKIDEVDTITFGLETDDGKIVKVFVNAEHADKFEKMMADMLGEEDNIEDALNSVASEVDIIDVEWPEEDSEDEEGGDAEDVDADLDDDGSDALDPQVYSKSNLSKEGDPGTKAAIESLTYGERFALKLHENDQSHSLAARLTTPSQQLVYQAIIELGVPEEALARNAYKSQIIRGIKATALEVQKRSTMKNALKMFVKRAIDFDLEDEGKSIGPHSKPTPVTAKVARALGVSRKIEEAVLTESPLSDLYWEVIDDLIKAVDADPKKQYADNVMALSAYKALKKRSATTLANMLDANVRSKLMQLQKTMGMTGSTPAVAEALQNSEVPVILAALISAADGDAGKTLSKQLLSNSAMKGLMKRAVNMASQIPSSVKTRIEALMKAMNAVKESAEPDAGADEDPDTAHQPAPPKSKGEVDLTGGPPTVDKVTWSVETCKGGICIKAEDGGGSHEVVDEDLERMMKALANRETITVKDSEGQKLVVSPRGRAAVIKVVGTQTRIELNAADVEKVLDTAAQATGINPDDEETLH